MATMLKILLLVTYFFVHLLLFGQQPGTYITLDSEHQLQLKNDHTFEFSSNHWLGKYGFMEVKGTYAYGFRKLILRPTTMDSEQDDYPKDSVIVFRKTKTFGNQFTLKPLEKNAFRWDFYLEQTLHNGLE